MVRLTDNEFKEIVDFVKFNYGINLINKRQLIESRLYTVLNDKKINSFSEYFKLIKDKNNDELSIMMNKLTTNYTYFLREPEHFVFLKTKVLPMHEKFNKNKDIRIWSAGCSTGEEAFTTVMIMKDYFGLDSSKWDTRILATDISTKVLKNAQAGVYSEESIKNIPNTWKMNYFNQKNEVFYELKPDIKKEVIFKPFNLMENFTFKKPFDIIFCRNVMIYFDQETKNNLIKKFYDALKPNGFLFIGHSESIQRGNSDFKYIQPSIYQKG